METVCSNNDQIEFWYNGTFPYHDVGNAVPATTMYSCLRMCLQDAACMAFSYSGFDQVCWVKSKAGTFSEELGFVGGIRCNHMADARPVRNADGTYPGILIF